jgi:hypothetical protein
MHEGSVETDKRIAAWRPLREAKAAMEESGILLFRLLMDLSRHRELIIQLKRLDHSISKRPRKEPAAGAAP